MTRLRPGALQDVQIEDGGVDRVKTQRLRAIRKDPGEICPRPVERHEIVADDLDPARGEMAQALRVVGQIALGIARRLLDVLVHGHAFHHRPA